MTDNIIFLEIRAKNGIFGRALRVAKARGVAHDLQPRDTQIDARGLRIIEEIR
jgi:KaiC/GvpD/RAD55 family RecA-like ATPase